MSCHEVVCADDRHAFIVSTTLGDASTEIEIWQNQRFVGLAARRLSPGDAVHRPLVTTIDCRNRTNGGLPYRPGVSRDGPADKVEAPPMARLWNARPG